jgi:hypothetical protein
VDMLGTWKILVDIYKATPITHTCLVGAADWSARKGATLNPVPVFFFAPEQAKESSKQRGSMEALLEVCEFSMIFVNLFFDHAIYL